MTRNWSQKYRASLRVSTLAIAAALVAGPSPAAAQSFQGTGSFTNGSGSISTTTGPDPVDNTTSISITSSQAVIDWTPTDNAVGNFGAIAFQYEGTTATFSSAADFAVLNRVNVADQTRILAMDGNINSLVNGVTGGAIYFYSPSGIVIGPHAVINVGSLVLSASPITVDGNGNFINGGTVVFGQAPNPDAAINIVSDINGTAQINTSGAGSYVALVAPTIWHQGDIRTDGAAALVAAEAATITFSPDGLFNIQVTVGTDAATGIHVDGGTIGRNDPTEGVFNHRAYLVAVAKNDAVTMLINNGASIGFDTATSAAVEDNVVVLSGGYDIQGGDHWVTSGVSEVPLTITNASFSTDVDAQVTGGAAIHSFDGALTFGGDLSIIGGETTTTGGNVLIDAFNGNPLTIAGDLYARAFRRDADGSQTGLITRLGSQQSSLVTVGGDVTLDSSSYGAAASGDGENGTQAIGGNAQVIADANSTITIGGSLTLSADGYGGNNGFSDGAGGNGIGGQVFLLANNGNATVNVGGAVYASAQGYGGSSGECSVCNITGGNGIGGSITILASAGAPNALNLDSDVTLIAAGYGGAGDASSGSGIGGFASLGAADGSTTTVGADTEVDASGYGGYGFDNAGGLGLGGEARIGVNVGTVDLMGPVFVTANGLGGDGGQGGTGTGGQAYINAFLGTIHAFNNVTVTALSDGGFGSSSSGGAGTADTETATTAEITEAYLFSSAGTLVVDGLTVVSANATGGDGFNFAGADGGDAIAGSATIHAANSDDGTSVIELGNVTVMADAFGGAGGSGTSGTDGGDGGDGGNATAGRTVMTAAAGSGDLTAGATILSASAEGGAGGSGGNGDGGNGGDGGDGGQAIGGFINVGSESGDANFAQETNNGSASYTTIVALATATGGSGGNGTFGEINGVAGNGGAAFGGQSVLLVRGSLVTVGDVNLDASAFGGDGGLAPNEAPEGSGGDATAGQVGVVVSNRDLMPDQRGTLNAGNIVGTAIAAGGNGLADGLSLAIGGNQFSILNSDATIASVSLVTTADAFDSGAPETFSSPIEIQNGAVDIASGFLFQTPGSVAMWSDDGTMNAASITVGGDNFIHDDALPFPSTIGTFSADLFDLSTNGDLVIDAHLVSTSSLDLSAPGLIDVEDAASGGDLTLNAGASISGGSMTAAGLIAADAAGDIGLNLVIAGTDIDIQSTAGSIATNAQSAGGSIFLDGATGISTGDLTAGSDVLLDSGASMSVGNVLAQAGSVQASAVDVLSFLSITAGTFVTIDPTAIIGGDIMALAGDVTATGDSIDIGNVTASDNVFLTALAGDLSTANISAGIDVTLDATGAITTGNITAFGTVDANGGSLDLGNISANILNLVSTIGDVSTGDLIAFGSLNVDSADDFLFGSIIAPLVDLFAPGSIIGGFIDSETDITAVAGADIDVGDLTAGGFDGEVFLFGDIFLTAGGDLSAGLVSAAGAVGADAGGGIATGAIDALDFVQLLAVGDIVTGDILAGSYIDIFSTSGGIATGDLTGTEIDLEAGGDISFGNVDADSLDFDATGAVAGGDIVAFSQVGGDAEGAITLGDITAGPGLPQVDDFSVGIASATSITVGNVSGTDRIGFATFGDLTTGDLSAGELVMTLVGGDIVTGSITTQSDGIVYMGDASLFIDAGGGEDAFDASLVLALDPVPTGGSITIDGPVSTGLFQAAAGGDLTTQAITADAIQALAGGLASISGMWLSPDVELWSNDIEIAEGAGIDGGSQGLIQLISTNATQALIGDGLTGTGYMLTNAEFGRLSAGNVQIFARGDASATIDMLIGDLSITGPAAGSTLEDPLGALVFATGDLETQTAGGVIRIVGDVTATGFADTNAIEFYTGRFELDAATGSLSIFESGALLGGGIYIEADRIHVASGEILDQLAINSHYAGYEDDLNAPADVQRPEGVIRAGSIVVQPTEAVLVQNTGTDNQRAGFTANFVDLVAPEGAGPGSIELIVNGQLLGQAGTLFGIEVRDAIVLGLDLVPFSANSTINGCLLVGSCVVEPPEPPFPPGFTPTPGIQQEIVLIRNNLLPPPEFDNENFIDDNDEATEDGETSPIEPPQPLFDTSGLGDKGDVDDPVSGSGNPALMEVGGPNRPGDGSLPPAPPPPSNQEKQP